MITDKQILKIAKGVAGKYAVDALNNYTWNQELFNDYVQELYMKAFELRRDDPNIPLNYIAKSLYNRAGDIYRKRVIVHHSEVALPVDRKDSADNTSFNGHVSRLIQEQSELFSDRMYEDVFEKDYLGHILAVLKTHPIEIQKYAIAKLKLNGYIPAAAYPEIKINQMDFEKQDGLSDHARILQDVLHETYAQSGGSTRFKKAKKDLFLQLIDEFDLKNVYKKTYVIAYKTKNGLVKVKKAKKYTETEALEYIQMQKDFKEVNSITIEM